MQRSVYADQSTGKIKTAPASHSGNEASAACLAGHSAEDEAKKSSSS